MSVQYKDYYNILGVARDASQQDIQKAYRKLARKHHPDVNKAKGAEDKFKEIGEAYEVLGDSEKRSRYDSLGANWRAGQEFTPPPDWEKMFAGFGGGGSTRPNGGSFQFQFDNASGFSDFFGTLFGGGSSPFGSSFAGRHSHPQEAQGASFRDQTSPQVLEADITLPLEDAYRGGTKTISLELQQREPTGQLKRTIKNLQVKIPPGVTEGSVIRLKGQSKAGSIEGFGENLHLRVHISPHPRFQILGQDLVTTIPVSPWEAALGAKVDIETLDGYVSISIPPGSQSGRQLRLRGKGLPNIKKGKDKSKDKSVEVGDLLVTIKILVPKELSVKEKELFEKLREESTFNPRV